MYDAIKLNCLDQIIITRLRDFPNMEQVKTNNTTESFQIFGNHLRMDFRKCFENGRFVGYYNLYLSISPHYHFNRYRHNGNDLSPDNARKSILDICAYLGIKQSEFDLFKVVNLEFGLNVIPKTDIKKLINGIEFYKKTSFKLTSENTRFSKITDATKQKNIKAYAKGIHCHEKLNAPEIDINTFRFEIKNKKSTAIELHGICTLNDMFKDEVFTQLARTLVKEWHLVHLINLEPNLATYKREDLKFIKQHSTVNDWLKIIKDKNRNKFQREKQKYFKILQGNDKIREEVLNLLNEKILSFGIGAYLPQESKNRKTSSTTLTERKTKDLQISKKVQIYTHAHVVKCTNAPTPEQPRKCLMTNINITMQKDESKFIFTTGLNYYREHDPNLYEKLLREFWSDDCRNKKDDDLHKIIAHNVRNKFWNEKYNRERFERRNYPKQQLQFNFLL
ncbi:MAG: hypothetical protein LC112_15315 [Flavobacteriales bacterium]|nr:hypothetical protein [Flavobacteriales bacterium]